MNIEALISLWNHTQRHVGTSGARVCAAVLLGLYNGGRFPMDVTDLRILDGKLLAAALDVIAADSRHCQYEVHTWLNKVSGHADFGDRFEVLAWEYESFKRGRSKKDTLSPHLVTFGPQGRMKVNRLVIDNAPGYRGKEATSVVVDELLELSPAAARIYDMDAPRGLGAKRQAAMLNLSYDQVTPQGLRLTAEQAAAVRAMSDNLPARTNQPLHDLDTLPNLFQQRNHAE